MVLNLYDSKKANNISAAFSVTSFYTLLTLYPLQKAWINTAACSSVRSRDAGMCGLGLTEREHLDCSVCHANKSHSELKLKLRETVRVRLLGNLLTVQEASSGRKELNENV